MILAIPFGKSLPPPLLGLLTAAAPVSLLVPLELSNGIPSTTNNASLFPVIVELPRKTILADEPTAPELPVTCAPAIFPLSALTRLASRASVRVAPFKLCAENPIAFSDFFTPKAVTTKPSSSVALDANLAFILVPETLSSCVFIP